MEFMIHQYFSTFLSTIKINRIQEPNVVCRLMACLGSHTAKFYIREQCK